jgi:hypothetical protein
MLMMTPLPCCSMMGATALFISHCAKKLTCRHAVGQQGQPALQKTNIRMAT